ncbi:MAG: acid phosphatase pho5 [Peltula sp. TS41687]|nr:MAG: acid phosphatase pho5 [Peltula sp. TS41687]
MSRPRSLLTISFLACFIGILFLLTRKSTQVALPPPISHHHPSSSSSSSSNETTHGDNSDGEPNNQHQVVPFFSLASFYTLVPYTSSWVSWWGTSENKRKHKKDKSIIDKDWNLLYHLGGNGPWIEKVDGVVAGGVAPPEGCAVEQVHMVC